MVAQRHLAHVHLEDLFAPADIRQADHHLAVEAARTQQRRVQNVRTVGGSDDDDAIVHLEAIHLHQQLVEGLLALVVTTAQAGAAMAATASISSMKMMHGACFLAWSNMSRTREAPTPTNISTKSNRKW